MRSSIVRHALAWLCALVCWALIPAAQADDGRLTPAKPRKLDVPADVQAICDKTTRDDVKRALGCGSAYWREREVVRKGTSSAPPAAFKAPQAKPICEAAPLLNSPDPAVEVDPAAQRLIAACGYATNPAREAAKACKAVSKAVAERQIEATNLSATARRSAAQERALTDVRSRIATLEQKRGAIGCDGRNDKPDLRGSAKDLPICQNLDAVKDLLSAGEKANLDQLCGRGETRAGAAAAVTFLTPIVQGLGDFLQARAKEELVTFAVEQLGRKFCAADAAKALNGQSLFRETCSVMFPNGGDADIDAVVSGRFQKALARDLFNLPVKLVELHGVAFESGDEEQQIRVIFEDVVTGLVAARPRGDKVLDFLEQLEAKIRADLASAETTLGQPRVDITPKCLFEKGKAAPPMACGMMLLLTAAAQAKPIIASGAADAGGAIADTGAWIEGTARAFCKNYGAPDVKEDAKCLGGGIASMDADLMAEIRDATDAVLAFYNDLVNVSQAAQDAQGQGKPSAEVLANAAAGISSAVRALTDALVSFSRKHLPAAGGNEKQQQALDRLQQIVDVTDEVFKAVAAAAKQDYKAVAASLRVVFDSPLVAAKMSPAFKQGVFFVFDVAEAKDREAVRKVFEDHAAPLGSYKAKYKASSTRVTLNGFVGFFGGVRGALVVNETNPAHVMPNLGYYQLSAPVGIDVSGPAIKEQNHLGVTFMLFDPLAVRVTQDKAGTQVDIDGTLAPGAYFRWGIFKSPIVFMIGARVQPALQSVEQNCGDKGNKACWQAPITGLAGLAIDIPILNLN